MRVRKFHPTAIIPWIAWIVLAIYVFKCMPPSEGEQPRMKPSGVIYVST